MSTDLIFFGTSEGYFYALNKKTGKMHWKFEGCVPIYTPPTVSEALVLWGSDDCYLYAAETQNGKLKWKFLTSGPIRSPAAICEEKVFVVSNENLYVLDLKTGKFLGQFKADSSIFSKPVVANDTVFIGTVNSYLYAIKINEIINNPNQIK